MRSVEDLFQVKAMGLWDTMNSSGGGMAGFKIPEYQRVYNWNVEEHLNRLLEDCIKGFHTLKSGETGSHTFLGTIILVEESITEPNFNGTSLSIVDGQQRLTTLVLLCCALIENLTDKSRLENIDSLTKNTKTWIEEEISFHCEKLFQCTNGNLRISRSDTLFPFPRIIRHTDTRAPESKDYEYDSSVAKFLNQFGRWYTHDQGKNFNLEDFSKKDCLHSNYEYIKKEIEKRFYLKNDNAEYKEQSIQVGDFGKKTIRGLFCKLGDIKKQDTQKVMSEIAKKSELEGLIKTVLFSTYLREYVVFTQVKTNDENLAFDIFDALNTTGEPLTALETLKPQVFKGTSDQKEHFKNIEERLNDKFPKASDRQDETKEMLVSFAQYFDGTRLGFDLKSQRKYLRDNFSPLNKKEELKNRFLERMEQIAEFRQYCWDPKEIEHLGAKHNLSCSGDDLDTVKLCLSLIHDMKTSLIVPILARFWEDKTLFIDAVKAITAFLVLRRSMTRGTAGIDNDFIDLIKGKDEKYSPLCVGKEISNPCLPIDEFKQALQNKIVDKANLSKDKEFDKKKWVDLASEIPLASHSRPLCRFLLFAAAHNSRPDSSNPGLFKRSGVKPDGSTIFLNYQTWRDKRYKTLEHIAPTSESGGWGTDIYSHPDTLNTIGNLVLLPQKENSTVSNPSWDKKKIFYRAFIAETKEEVEEVLKEAKSAGFKFNKHTTSLLKEGDRLTMLCPLPEVDKWTKETITNRSQNTLMLAWDKIAPWLYSK